NVEVTGANGCKIAVGINIILGLKNWMNDNGISVWPNPVNEKFTIYDLQITIGRVEIYNILGQLCSKSEIKPLINQINQRSEIELDVSFLPSGIYFVRLNTDHESWVGRF